MSIACDPLPRPPYQGDISKDDAAAVAEQVLRVVEPACYRCGTTGLLRRGYQYLPSVTLICAPVVEQYTPPQQITMFGTQATVPKRKTKPIQAPFTLNRALRAHWADGRITDAPPDRTGRRPMWTDQRRQFLWDGWPVDLVLVIGGNYIVQRWVHTGSEGYIAEALGHIRMSTSLRYARGALVTSTGDEAAVGETERAMYDRVGLPYREPRDRDEGRLWK